MAQRFAVWPVGFGRRCSGLDVFPLRHPVAGSLSSGIGYGGAFGKTGAFFYGEAEMEAGVCLRRMHAAVFPRPCRDGRSCCMAGDHGAGKAGV